MGKRVGGSFTSIDATIQAVRRLLNEGDYLSGDITIVTNKKNQENVESLTSVQVDKVTTVEDKTTWERFKGMFSSPNDEATLEQYGIETHEALKLEEDLENGNYILIVEESNLNDNHSEPHVTSIDDAIVEARDEQDSGKDISVNNPSVKESETIKPAEKWESENEEDPLLDGTVDRGPIYGVVNDEKSGKPLDDIVEDNTK